MNKSNQKLLGVLVIQVVFVLLVWWPKNSQTLSFLPLFEGVAPADLQSISFWGDDKTVILKKQNETWVVPEQYEFPASEKKINEVFEKLTKVKTNFTVSQTKPSHERLEVSEKKFQRKVAFSKGQAPSVDEGFYLGSTPQFRKVHIRKFKDEKVYVTNQISTFDLPLRSQDWIEKNLTDMDPDQLLAIELIRGKEILKFSKKTETAPASEEKTPGSSPQTQDVWYLGNQKVSKSVFDSILRNLGRFQIKEVLGTSEKREYGLKKPKARIKVFYQSNDQKEEKTFLIGQAMENDYVVQEEGKPFYVKVPAYRLNSLMDTPKKEFLEKT